MGRQQDLMQLLGLTPLQARVYVALATGGPATAGRLASVTNAPRTRLYEVLASMQERDLVEAHLAAPRLYRARPIADVIEREVEALRRRADTLLARSDELASQFATEPAELNDSTGPAKLLQGRRAVAREIDELLDAAQRDVVLMSTVGAIPRLVKHILRATEGRDPPKIHFVVPEAARGSDALAGLKGSGVHLHMRPFLLRSITLLVDERDLLRIHPRPDDERRLEGQDVAMRSLNPAFIHDQAVFLYSLLGLATPPRPS